MKHLLLSLILLGCGSSIPQSTLSATAQLGLMDTQDIRVLYHENRNAFCFDAHPPAESVFSDYVQCMEPSVRLDTAVGVADAALRATQASLDAAGEDGFKAMLPDLVAAFSSLADVLVELGLELPEVVTKVLALGSLL